MVNAVKFAAFSLALIFLCRPAPAGDLAAAVGGFSLAELGRTEASAYSPALLLPPAALGADEGGKAAYFGAKIGPIWQLDDLDFLDTGISVEGYAGYKILPFIRLELSGGYFRNEGDEDDVDVELWGIPLQANLVVRVPILLFEPYAGVGAGGYYVNAKASAVDWSGRNESFRFGLDAFVGLALRVAFLRLGIEGKYFWTDEIADPGEDDPNLQTFALLFGAGIDF